MSDKHWLFIFQGPPYYDSLTMPGLDAAMAAGAFGQHVSVLFTGTAALQLRAGQTPPENWRHVGKTIAGMPLYDIEHCYVDQRYADTDTLDPALDLTLLDASGIRALIANANVVLSF